MAHLDHAPSLGAVSGIATLDGTGNVPLSQLGNAPGGTVNPSYYTTPATTITVPVNQIQFAAMSLTLGGTLRLNGRLIFIK